MKKILFPIVFIIFCFCFSACEATNNNITNYGDENRIIYSTNFGTKIEDLSNNKQSTISNYVSDCKILLVNSYKELINGRQLANPYIDITDTFVYDFSSVNENNLDEDSLSVWNSIKKMNNNEAKPLMYIQINGYCNFFSDDYVATQISETSLIHGYFIFKGNIVVPASYHYISSSSFIYQLPKGTTIINCGNKYSEKNTSTDIHNFDDTLKILTVKS